MEFILKYKVIIITIIIILIAGGIYVYNTRFLDGNSGEEIIQGESEKSYIEELIGDKDNKDGERIVIHVTGAVKKSGVVILNEGARIYEAIEKAEGSLENADLSQINLAYMLEDGQKLYIPFKGDNINNNTIEDGDFSDSENGGEPNSNIRDSGSKNGTDKEIRNSETASKVESNVSNSETKKNIIENGIRDSENNISGNSNNGSTGVIDSGNVSNKSGSSKTSSSSKVNINTAYQTELETLPGIGTVTAGKIIEYRNKNGKFKTVEDIKSVSGIGDAKYEKIKDYITIK